MTNDYISRADALAVAQYSKDPVEGILNLPGVFGWIPVTERLPEDGEMVLVLASGKPHENITLIDAYELAEYSRGEDCGWILEMWPEWMEAEVTHWMPLPLEPPKEAPHV